MADTSQEKTEQPTPRRRTEARDEGQIGKSQDLSAAVVLLGGLLLLYYTGQKILARLVDLTRGCLQADRTATDVSAMGATLMGVLREAALIVLPLMLLVLVLALVSMFLQVGWLFSFKPVRPSLGKLNPLNGLKRMFGPRAFIQLVMGLAKMSLLGLVAYMTIRDEVNTLVFASSLHKLGIVALAAQLVFRLGIRLALVLLILAIFDYIYQRHRTEKDIMMTKEEVKEEMKRMEGDPKVKQRRRQVQMQMALKRIRAAVPKADVVITNPTELAIAIQYDERTMNAPRVTAKGAGLLAKHIRELAIEYGVPIVERKPLAQALYKTVEVGQEIPAQFYRAVAEILAYVYELAGGRSRRMAAPVGLN